ncbi:MAG: GSCFA domain-containing protein [Telmatospirillum sp.]|nr:GSCFA domain-containing protein [Telmatospirillum sp.]
MLEMEAQAAYRIATKNRWARFPTMEDPRYQAITTDKTGFLRPMIDPKFKIKSGDTVFTIGSCFVREIEPHLEAFGCRVPVRQFPVPWTEMPLGQEGVQIFNEYTAGTMCQRILSAFGKFKYDLDAGLEMSDGAFRDLLLQHNATPVALDRLIERREQIDTLYKEMKNADVVLITLGLIEAWYEESSGVYLNRTPNFFNIKKNPKKFCFRTLEYEESLDLMDKAISCLVEGGVKQILLTVSPVALLTSFTDEDVIMANCYSKSVLRCVAHRMKNKYSEVDYFPSYELATSFGMSGYQPDNFHVHPFAVEQIMNMMKSAYFL